MSARYRRGQQASPYRLLYLSMNLSSVVSDEGFTARIMIKTTLITRYAGLQYEHLAGPNNATTLATPPVPVIIPDKVICVSIRLKFGAQVAKCG